MKKDHIWNAVLAFGVALAALVLCQLGWREAGGKSDVDLSSTVSAIATAGATIVALYVAIQTYRERSRQEHVRARLMATRLAPALLLATAKLTAVQRTLEAAAPSSGAPTYYKKAETLLEEIVSLEPSIDDLQAIDMFDDHCADRITAAFAQLRMLNRMLKDDQHVHGVEPSQVNQRREKASMYIGMTKSLLQTIQPAVEICNRSAQVKIGGVSAN